jgi:hypothetical protein
MMRVFSLLELIITHGNRGHNHVDLMNTAPLSNIVVCADGFTVSVIAGGGTYCTPRPVLCAHPYNDELCSDTAPVSDIMYTAACKYSGPYTEVEVGYPSDVPEPWEIWAEFVEDAEKPTETVYAYVPVEDVRDLIRLHGGEVDDAE